MLLNRIQSIVQVESLQCYQPVSPVHGHVTNPYQAECVAEWEDIQYISRLVVWISTLKCGELQHVRDHVLVADSHLFLSRPSSAWPEAEAMLRGTEQNTWFKQSSVIELTHRKSSCAARRAEKCCLLDPSAG